MPTETWQPTSLSWVSGFAAADLNSLANETQRTSSLGSPHITNDTGNPATLIMFEFIAGSAFTPALNGFLICALAPLMSDNTNYASYTDNTFSQEQLQYQNYPHSIIALRSVSSTERQQSPPVPIYPQKYRIMVINRSGVALPASGNMIRYALLNRASY